MTLSLLASFFLPSESLLNMYMYTHLCLGISTRGSILQVLTRGLRLEDGFSFSELAHTTPGYVGADLRALIREASLCAVSRHVYLLYTHVYLLYMHVYLLYTHIYLLEVTKQLTCMKHLCCTSNRFCITTYSSYIHVLNYVYQQISCSAP